MLYDDESDIRPSLCSTEYLESPVKAKREALKQKLKKEGLQKLNDTVDTGGLKSLKLSVLKQQMEGKKDDEKKRADEAKDKKGTSMGTKTREQEIAAQSISAADAKPTAEQVTKQANQDDKAQQEIQDQEVSGEGG